MKKLMAVVLLVAMVLLYGCIEYEEELVLNADGSGTLIVKYAMSEQFAAMGGQDEKGGKMPMDKKKIEEEFAGKEGIKLRDVSVTVEDEKRIISYTVEFDNIDNLLESGMATFKEGLKFVKNEDGTFTYERKPPSNEGMDGGMKMEPVEEEISEGEEDTEVPEGMKKMGEEMAKGMMKGMMGGEAPKFTYKLTLPAAIAETNADKHEGNTAEWKIEFDMSNPEAMEGKVMTAKTSQPGGFPLLPVVIVVVIIVIAGVIAFAVKGRK